MPTRELSSATGIGSGAVPGDLMHATAERIGTLGLGALELADEVGVDALTLSTVSRPELELLDANNRNVGLDVLAASTTIRRIAITPSYPEASEEQGVDWADAAIQQQRSSK